MEVGLRPRTLEEFVGQEEVRRNLEIAMDAARARGEAVDHILVHGPPGSGQDHPGLHHRPRDGRRHQVHLRAGD